VIIRLVIVLIGYWLIIGHKLIMDHVSDVGHGVDQVDKG